jgi:hypothetical protein
MQDEVETRAPALSVWPVAIRLVLPDLWLTRSRAACTDVAGPLTRCNELSIFPEIANKSATCDHLDLVPKDLSDNNVCGLENQRSGAIPVTLSAFRRPQPAECLDQSGD